jgi:hypothetical protein
MSERRFLLAGFQVTTIGRFWVTAEVGAFGAGILGLFLLFCAQGCLWSVLELIM